MNCFFFFSEKCMFKGNEGRLLQNISDRKTEVNSKGGGGVSKEMEVEWLGRPGRMES